MGCGGDHGIQATIMGTGCVQTWLRKTPNKYDVNENMAIIYILVVPVSLGILIVGPISNQWMDIF